MNMNMKKVKTMTVFILKKMVRKIYRKVMGMLNIVIVIWKK